MKKIAFMYDFDDTLAKSDSMAVLVKDLFGYELEDWYGEANAFASKHNMDPILASLYFAQKKAKEKGIKLTQEVYKKYAKKIEFFKGVETWFSRLNRKAQKEGVEIEHYIISSGIREMMVYSSIAKHFKKIFASEFLYDETGEIVWAKHAINYTTKTQFLYRIRKNKIQNLSDLADVNEYIKDKSKILPYKNMVYLGDGLTDIPCMKILTIYGGTSICVYKEDVPASKELAQKLFEDKRVNYFAKADYSRGTALEKLAFSLIEKVAKEE